MLDFAHLVRAGAEGGAPTRDARTITAVARPSASSGPMREALRGLFRGGRAPEAEVPGARRATLRQAGAERRGEGGASARDHAIHPARGAAHAASRAVESGGLRTVDVAVPEAGTRALRRRCRAKVEAPKLLRLYADDDWARSVGAQALEGSVGPADPPGFLQDPTLAEREPSRCGDRR